MVLRLIASNFLFAAIFLLASCTDFERNNPDDTGSINYDAVGTYGEPVTYEGETYKTVVIGEQTWFQRNLNYDVPDNDTDVCYDNDPANCAIYGRLYDWATAMALPDACNSSSCASRLGAKNNQGICPSGWHIPNDDDWNTLLTAVGGDSTAGTKLKARDGWNNNGNGTDEFGFSALPGGGLVYYDYDVSSFHDVGKSGLWWSDREVYGYGGGTAYGRVISTLALTFDGRTEDVMRFEFDKIGLYSIRCLKD